MGLQFMYSKIYSRVKTVQVLRLPTEVIEHNMISLICVSELCTVYQRSNIA